MKQDQRALDAYQRALQLNPNSVDATAGLAEAKVAAGQAAEGIALLEKGIALQSAGGAHAPETWYKRALQIAYKAKLPQAMEISRQWLAAYPTTEVQLTPGCVLALYTDGLIEAPGVDIEDALAELGGQLAETGDRPLDELADELVRRGAAARERSDDVALLLLRADD